ncbi:hypothetical protein ACQ4PT_027029 [Festuca glaucescens]
MSSPSWKWSVSFSSVEDLDNGVLNVLDGELHLWNGTDWIALFSTKGKPIIGKFLADGDVVQIGSVVQFSSFHAKVTRCVLSPTEDHKYVSDLASCKTKVLDSVNAHKLWKVTYSTSKDLDRGRMKAYDGSLCLSKDGWLFLLNAKGAQIDRQPQELNDNFSIGSKLQFHDHVVRMGKAQIIQSRPAEVQSSGIQAKVSLTTSSDTTLLGESAESLGAPSLDQLDTRVELPVDDLESTRANSVHASLLWDWTSLMFKCFFHLWGRGGPNWRWEFDRWQKENAAEWTLVSSSKHILQHGLSALKRQAPKSILSQAHKTGKKLVFADSINYDACLGYQDPKSSKAKGYSAAASPDHANVNLYETAATPSIKFGTTMPIPASPFLEQSVDDLTPDSSLNPNEAGKDHATQSLSDSEDEAHEPTGLEEFHYWNNVDPIKERVLVYASFPSIPAVPRDVVFGRFASVGGARDSWTAPVFILSADFADVLPADEDPMPPDGNPHPMPGNLVHDNNLFANPPYLEIGWDAPQDLPMQGHDDVQEGNMQQQAAMPDEAQESMILNPSQNYVSSVNMHVMDQVLQEQQEGLVEMLHVGRVDTVFGPMLPPTMVWDKIFQSFMPDLFARAIPLSMQISPFALLKRSWPVVFTFDNVHLASTGSSHPEARVRVITATKNCSVARARPVARSLTFGDHEVEADQQIATDVGKQRVMESSSTTRKKRVKKSKAPLFMPDERRFTRSCLKKDGYRPALVIIDQKGPKKKARSNFLLSPQMDVY